MSEIKWFAISLAMMAIAQMVHNQAEKERQEQIVELLKEITHDTNE